MHGAPKGQGAGSELKGHRPGRSAGFCFRYAAMSWLKWHLSPSMHCPWRLRLQISSPFWACRSCSREHACGVQQLLSSCLCWLLSLTARVRLVLEVRLQPYELGSAM